ncbi:HlyD family efflux transporter periplasmic adaptor subunit [Pseudomonas sp. C27(2019)]|uniref:HlyD family secretion protein n=1 Tax=Pseudomonas sp. C27(2019) TaxID=2604941 RepID=UPI001243D68A|nr:HlyD family efflux transporter periplasmic adaptor subunit [Pseudomonas sp. C27(2019)]QEY60195.1 HlyD family efflux transporter periplasmic adaptor subunit [Pseudomonas sp. C27(2019)]
MKVRFTSNKERNPAQDGGLKVIYAPSKRIAYRLRWYLILLVVASPFIWFSSKLIGSMVLLDAPARTVQPLTEVRALESGTIRQLRVKTGDQVASGTLLVVLDNPVLLAQHQAVMDTLDVMTLGGTPLQRQQQILHQQLERARLRSIELQRLVDMGAATRGELYQARDLLNDRQVALAEIERQLAPTNDQEIYTRRNQSDLIALDKRLEQLQITANSDVVIRDIVVNEGEAVGPGTLLMQLQKRGIVEIEVYLDARQRELARIGQELKLRLPDGQWLDAKVTSEPKLVTRLPPGMRTAFDNDASKLLLMVETIELLGQEWQIDNLPLTARFPSRFQRWLP